MLLRSTHIDYSILSCINLFPFLVMLLFDLQWLSQYEGIYQFLRRLLRFPSGRKLWQLR